MGEFVVANGPLDLVDTGDGITAQPRTLQEMSEVQQVHVMPVLPERKVSKKSQIAVPSLDLANLKHSTQRSCYDVTLIRQGPQWRHFGFTVGLDADPSYLTVDAMWSPSLVAEW